MGPKPPTSDLDPGAVVLRVATLADVHGVAALVDAAYQPYLPRLGSPPGPMLLDYRQVITDNTVTLAETGGHIVGLIVTARESETLWIHNVAVHPDLQGRGIGRLLLDHAESAANASGCRDVRLYTHERMTENLAFYARRGYTEYERRRVDDAVLVYLSKPTQGLRPHPASRPTG